MMDRKLFTIAVFLLFSFSALSVFSQATSGCCVDTATSDVCTYNSAGSSASCGGTFYPGPSCDPSTVTQCAQVCMVCNGPSGSVNVWDIAARRCDRLNTQGGQTYAYGGITASITTETACNQAAPPTTQPSYSNITVTVRDAGALVDGATVNSVACSFSSSISSGIYKLTNCVPGPSVEVIAVKGDKIGRKSLTLQSNIETNTNIDIALAPTAKLTVVVRDQTGAPISQASVTAGGVSNTTDSSGTVVFSNAPLGSLTIAAQKAQYASNATTITLSGDTAITLVLAPGATTQVSGFILGTTVPRVDAAAIQAYHYAGASKIIDAAVISDSLGHYSVSIPAGQTYTLQINKTGYQTINPTLTVASGTTTLEKNFTLSELALGQQTTTLVVTVKQSDTQALVSDASVSLSGQTTVNTGADGKAILSLQNNAGYIISVSKPGYRTANQIITGGIGALTIQIDILPVITITGRVINSTGNPIPQANVGLLDISRSVDGSGHFSISTPFDTNLATQLQASFSAQGYITTPRGITLQQGVTSYPLGDITLGRAACSDEDSLMPKLSTDLNKNNITLSWVASCQAVHFVILRKIGSGAYSQRDVVDTTKATYLDGDLDFNTQYCYEIQATYNLGGALGVQTRTSAESCKTTTSALCQQGDGTFCNGNTVVTCQNGGATPVSCSDGQLCIQQTKTTASCVSQAQCDQCNRPFGVFSGVVSQSSTSAIFGGKGFEQNVFTALTGGNNMFTANPYFCSQIQSCYKDFSRTTVEKYYSCKGITSCYDYDSQAACNTNTCTPSLTCDWVPSGKYNSLGVGVCRPHEVSQQDCGAFQTSFARTIANKVFASDKGVVAKELCQLYGPSCYFSEQSNRCLNKDQVSCYDYGNAADCLGPNANNDAAQSVQVNVQWLAGNAAGASYTKAGGNNAIIQKSNDYFNIGICKYINGCIRDADSNNQEVINGNNKFDTSNGKTLDLQPDGRDCPITATGAYDSTCALDAIPPMTFLNVQDGAFIKNINFGYVVSDNGPTSLDKTRYKVILSGSPINPYPTTLLTSAAQNITSTQDEGQKNIYYFSEDASHNLEMVKSISVTVDKTIPQIDFDTNVIPDVAGKKVTFVAILSLPATHTHNPANGLPNDAVAYCVEIPGRTGLYKVNPDGTTTLLANHPADSSLGNDPKKSWVETYPNINTATPINAVYKWVCYDQAGNEAARNAQIRLDADGMIYDPQPSAAVKDRQNIPISIKTLFPGECRYTDNTATQYKTRTLFETNENGGKTHSSTTSVPLSDYQQLFVSCNITGVKDIIDGSSADTIKITIDDKEPKTQLFISGKPATSTGSAYWVSSTSQVELKCQDTPQGSSTGSSDFPPESGCESVYYCIDTSSATTPCTPISASSTDAFVAITQSSILRYYSKDMLENTESTKTQSFKYDDEMPIIDITSPVPGVITETRDKEITLAGTIRNEGTGDISPLVNASYSLIDQFGNTLRSEPLDISTPVAGGQPINRRIVLGFNKVNTLQVVVADAAGNIATYTSSPIIQDSAGPNLTIATFKGQTINTDAPRYWPYSEFGQDFLLDIQNLRDVYSAGSADDLCGRVSAVWVTDMFGTRYDLSRDGTTCNSDWTGVIKTSAWPVTSSDFPTFITAFAQDTAGNVAQIVKNISNRDTVPPTATLSFENQYGETIGGATGILLKGMNYIVLSASEPLNATALAFTDTNGNQYNVTFTARDFEAVTWVGFVNIPDSAVGPAIVKGIMMDNNRMNSTTLPQPFGIATVPIDTTAYSIPVPSPANYVDGAYYVNQPVVTYVGFNPALSYSFLADGYALDFDGSSVSGLSEGLHTVTIRIEDGNDNYHLATQTVFINTTVSVPTGPGPVLDANSISYEDDPTLKTIDGKLVSRSPSVTLKYPASGITRAYVLGQDKKVYEGQSETAGSALTFRIPLVKLVGRTFEEQLNSLSLVAVGPDGARSQILVSITKDLMPPVLIKLLLGTGLNI